MRLRLHLALQSRSQEELHSAVTPSKSRVRPKSQPIIRREYKETALHSNQSCDVTLTCDAASLVTLCRCVHRIGQGAERADTDTPERKIAPVEADTQLK